MVRGNHREISGKRVMMIKANIMTPRKGKTPRVNCSIGVSNIELVTNMITAIGGVMPLGDRARAL